MREAPSATTEINLQAAIRAINEAAGNSPDRQLIAAKCRALMAGYDLRWRNQRYTLLGSEQTIQSELWNPETGHRSRTFKLAAKVDKLATDGTRLILFDHKTTSEDIADPAATYWRQLAIEAQASHYMLMLWLNGQKVDMAIWDVIRKPQIAPKQITKAELQRLLITQEYFGFSVTDQALYNAQKGGREDYELYEARLSQDCMFERPERYYQRRPVPRLDNDLIEHARELWAHGQDLIWARANDRHLRNSGSCMNHGAPCRYLGVCSGFDEIDSQNWARKSQVHSELALEGDGRDVLTHSRIRSFQTCRRKHQYDYEIGVRRVEEEDSEALYLGNLMHLALDVWWRKQNERNADGSNDKQDASATDVESVRETVAL